MQALADHGGEVVPFLVGTAAVDRVVLAERFRALAAEGVVAGVVSLLAWTSGRIPIMRWCQWAWPARWLWCKRWEMPASKLRCGR